MKIDPKEFELPETIFIRDIDTRVFHSIILQCLSKIKGVSLVDGNFIDSLLGREGTGNVKGIVVEQDQKNHSVSVKVEVGVVYGVPIPEKAEEIQTAIALEMTKLTGLHVSCVHVVFKNLLTTDPKQSERFQQALALQSGIEALEEQEYSENFEN